MFGSRWFIVFVLLLPASFAGANEPRNFTPAAQGLDAELKQRFLAAAVVAQNPLSPDHIDTLIEVLRAAENDFSVKLGSRDMLEVAIGLNPAYQAYFDRASSKGLRFYQPIEAAAKAPASRHQRTFIISSIAYASLCLPTEVEYNTRFVAFLAQQKWPREHENFAPVRYGLLLRMWHRQCISNRTFANAGKPLLAGIRKLAQAPGMAPGDLGALLYLLAASEKLDLVPGDLLLRFARAQESSGAWSSAEVKEPAITAAHGLYVLGAMLKKNGQQVSNLEIFKALRAKPVLPAAVALQPVP